MIRKVFKKSIEGTKRNRVNEGTGCEWLGKENAIGDAENACIKEKDDHSQRKARKKCSKKVSVSNCGLEGVGQRLRGSCTRKRTGSDKIGCEDKV